MTALRVRRLGSRRGETMVEFALSVVLLLMVVFSVFESVRLLLAYTTVTNAAQVGTRYAIVHGNDDSASTSTIQSVVINYLHTAPISAGNATITVSYPDANSCTRPGCHVQISVSYPYDEWITYFKLPSFTVESTSEGVITF